MFCWLLSILSIQLYRVLKNGFQLLVLPVTVNPINTIVPCAEGQGSAAYSAGSVNHINKIARGVEGHVSAACSPGYCQSY